MGAIEIAYTRGGDIQHATNMSTLDAAAISLPVDACKNDGMIYKLYDQFFFLSSVVY